VLASAGDPRGAERALKQLHHPTGGDAYSRRWGVNFAEEARLASPNLIR
jgi:hypothetical protein